MTDAIVEIESRLKSEESVLTDMSSYSSPTELGCIARPAKGQNLGAG